MKVEQVELGSLVAFEGNARRGDVAAIAESLRANGQYRPIVVNAGSHTGRVNEVLVGNHTVDAAKSLGWATIAAVFADVTDDQAVRIVLADNRTSDLASYDDATLAWLIDEVGELDGTGFSRADAEALRALVADEPGDAGSGESERAPADDTAVVKLYLTAGTAELLSEALGESPEVVVADWLGGVE